MEIKKRLNAVAKRLNPQIESMNVAQEMREHTKRIEELTTYAEAKIARSKERKETLGKRAQDEAEAEAKRIAEVQDAEARENAADQNQQDAQPGEDVRTPEEVAEDNGVLAEGVKEDAG